jgi:glycosyltransferase involved in cell wall biosynthesis
MRICCLSVSDQLGGSEVALAGMIAAIGRVRPEWQFDVVLPGNGPLRDRIVEAGARCTVVPMPGALARMGEWSAVQEGWSTGARVALGLKLCETAASLPGYESRLARAIADAQPDIVHTNGLKAHVLGARVKTSRQRLIWHLHEYVSPRKLTRWLLRRYGSRCSAIVANSASVADDVATSIDTAPPIHIVTNSVDLGVFSPTGPRLDLDSLAGLPSPPSGIVRVGLVATYGRWKGHDVFLDALARTVSSAHAVRGYIIGGPLYDTSDSQYTRADLQAMIESRQLGDHVGLTGFVEPAAAMRTLDVIVHASTQPEPFGLAIAEAMACGRAVVTTGHGGAAEFVEDGRNALIARAGDMRALANAVERLVIDVPLRKDLGNQAHETALARFSPDRMALHLAQVFEAIDQPAIAHSA